MSDTVERWIAERDKTPERGFLADGEVVGEWVVKGLIGRGGSAEIFRVERADGTPAALKLVLKPFEDRVAHRHFERECQVLSAGLGVRFPHWYGRGEVRGHAYLVEELLRTYDTLPRGRRAVARYLAAVCEGVSRLHAYGFVHRDLKPANIMYRVGADGKDEPVLVDFGLAAPCSSGSPRDVSRTLVDGRLVVSGTPGYVAPELLTGGDITAAVDIHALGVLASRCFPEGLPFEYRKVVIRAMSSVPDYRYSSITEFSSALFRAFRFRFRFAWGVVATICALLVLFSGIMAVRGGWGGQGVAIPDPEKEPDAFASWCIETLLERGMEEYQNQLSGKYKIHQVICLPDLGPESERTFQLSDAVRDKYAPRIEALRKEIEENNRAGKCGKPLFYTYDPRKSL